MAKASSLLELELKLGKLAASLESADVAPFMPVIRTLAQSDSRRRFLTSTSPEGIPWTPLRHPRLSGGAKPLMNFGTLAASITVKTSADTVTMGTNLIHAGIHQSGGVIVPVRAKFLAIPLTAEAMRWGGPRHPRPFPRKLYPAIRANGTGGGLMEKRGDQEIFHYALVRKVVVPARPFLGFSKMFVTELTALYGEILEMKADKELGGG